ncbi:MAG: hypothetical protein MRY78_08210 [Saprospiraceae bacterium]|nr:hypothetical protein [Saprospiraceae bacterium]
MKQTYTENDLLRYLYRETSVTDTLAIEDAMAADRNLTEAFEGMQEAFNQLPRVKFGPSKSSIEKILSYSKETALEEQP